MTRPPDPTPPVEPPTDARPEARPGTRADAARFRATLVRVMTVQVVTLILLWLLQRGYSA